MRKLLKFVRIVFVLITVAFVLQGCGIFKEQSDYITIKNGCTDNDVISIPAPKNYGAFLYYDEDVTYKDFLGEDTIEPGNQIVHWEGSESDLEIPNEIKGIPMKILGSEAIVGQEELTSIVFPDSPMELKVGAVQNCPNLTKVTIHDALQIADNPFVGCPNLREFDLGSEAIRYDLIEGNLCDLESMILITPTQTEASTCRVPEPIQKIGGMAYYERSDIITVVFPESVTEIGYRAFSGCSNLHEIIWPEGIKEIGQLAFERCDNLTIVRLPESVETIGPFAFEECENLEAVFIPDSVQEIGFGAFEYCPNVCVYAHKGSYAEDWLRNKYNYSSELKYRID